VVIVLKCREEKFSQEGSYNVLLPIQNIDTTISSSHLIYLTLYSLRIKNRSSSFFFSFGFLLAFCLVPIKLIVGVYRQQICLPQANRFSFRFFFHYNIFLFAFCHQKSEPRWGRTTAAERQGKRLEEIKRRSKIIVFHSASILGVIVGEPACMHAIVVGGEPSQSGKDFFLLVGQVGWKTPHKLPKHEASLSPISIQLAQSFDSCQGNILIFLVLYHIVTPSDVYRSVT